MLDRCDTCGIMTTHLANRRCFECWSEPKVPTAAKAILEAISLMEEMDSQ